MPMHLTDDYTETLCGKPLSELVDSDWMDDAVEFVTDPSDECPTCLANGRALLTVLDRSFDDGWQHEIARESGMLRGVEAYNEVMGY